MRAATGSDLSSQPKYYFPWIFLTHCNRWHDSSGYTSPKSSFLLLSRSHIWRFQRSHHNWLNTRQVVLIAQPLCISQSQSKQFKHPKADRPTKLHWLQTLLIRLYWFPTETCNHRVYRFRHSSVFTIFKVATWLISLWTHETLFWRRWACECCGGSHSTKLSTQA